LSNALREIEWTVRRRQSRTSSLSGSDKVFLGPYRFGEKSFLKYEMSVGAEGKQGAPYRFAWSSTCLKAPAFAVPSS